MIRRARGLKNRKPKRPPRSMIGEIDHRSTKQLQLLDVQHVSHQPFLKNQATCFVLYQYVLDGAKRSRGYLSHLKTICAVENNPAVMAAISALGLASLSNLNADTVLMIKARKEYTVALAAANEALCDPASMTADSTLAAVILLGMFEVRTH